MRRHALPIRVMAFASAVILAGAAAGQPVGVEQATAIAADQITVTDGDTIRVVGEPAGHAPRRLQRARNT